MRLLRPRRLHYTGCLQGEKRQDLLYLPLPLREHAVRTRKKMLTVIAVHKCSRSLQPMSTTFVRTTSHYMEV